MRANKFTRAFKRSLLCKSIMHKLLLFQVTIPFKPCALNRVLLAPRIRARRAMIHRIPFVTSNIVCQEKKQNALDVRMLPSRRIYYIVSRCTG